MAISVAFVGVTLWFGPCLLGLVYLNLGMVTLVRDWVWGHADVPSAAVEKRFEISINRNSGGTGAYRNLGYLYILEGDYRRAVAVLTKATELDPRDPVASLRLGVALDAVGEPDEAVAAWRQGHAEQYFVSQGYYYYYGRKYDQAEAQLRLALRVRPGAAGVSYLLADLYLEEGAYSEAEEVLRSALKIDEAPSFDRFYYQGRLLLLEKRPSEAAEALRNAVRANPASVRAHSMLAQALLDSNRPEDAADQVEKAIDLDPHSPSLYILAGHAYFQRKLFERAVVSYLRAAELNASLPSTYVYLGRAYRALEMLPLAIENYRHAIGLQPTDKENRRELAQTYEADGQVPSAIEEYEQILRLDKGDRGAALALQRLGAMPAECWEGGNAVCDGSSGR